jgi:prepilin-type N-terminal cleavage/methylation domain-containing protein
MVGKGMKNKGGFTLVEILLAIFVLGIGFLGILTLFPVGLDATRDMLANSRAAMIASTTRATLSAMKADWCILDWQWLNHADPQKDGPWYYPHDDEVFVPDDFDGAPQAVRDAGYPFSFIVGDDDDENDVPGLEVIECEDNKLYSFNVVILKTVPSSLSGKPYSVKIVGNVSADGMSIDPYSPSLPEMDSTECAAAAVTVNAVPVRGTTQALTVAGKLHVRATFGGVLDRTIVKADTGNGWYWPDELKVGDCLKAPDDKWYRVVWLNRSTDPAADPAAQTLKLSRPYQGTSGTAVALIDEAGGKFTAQIVVFRNREIVAPEEQGQLSTALGPGGCLVTVVYSTRADYDDSDLKPVKLRAGDHIAFKSDPNDPDYKHGFWYEIAYLEVTESSTGEVTVEMALQQPEDKVREEAGSYNFVVTRSVVGLYETSVGQH